ncbi:hypothetical protein EK21DRAFT_115492 [Setomelanomma holmii]|uniref:Uncharacterized protein n=1 Tax=Setomelanomma holmii TaxID=210430 RepID=A0A9P4LHG0_9PLEO|nr:hypothetical protein EK21DRAFT_115492 [Setomelanomma holmii]
MPAATIPDPVFGSSTGNIIKDKASKNDKVNIIKDITSAPLNKALQRRMSREAKKEKKERTELPTTMSHQPQDTFEKTGFVIPTDETATEATALPPAAAKVSTKFEQSLASPLSRRSPETSTGSSSVSGHQDVTLRDDHEPIVASMCDEGSMCHANKREELRGRLLAKVSGEEKKRRKKTSTNKGSAASKQVAKKTGKSSRKSLEQSPQSPPSSTARNVTAPRPPAEAPPKLSFEHYVVPVIDISLDFFVADNSYENAVTAFDKVDEETEEIYASGPATWAITTNTSAQAKDDDTVECSTSAALISSNDIIDTVGLNEDEFAAYIAACLPNFDGAIDGLDEADFSTNIGVDVSEEVDSQSDDTVAQADHEITPVYEDDVAMEGSTDGFVSTTPDVAITAKFDSELGFLSFPNAALHPSPLSRDEDFMLIALHVIPLRLPTARVKSTRAEKKAAKKMASAKSAIVVEEHTVLPLVEGSLQHDSDLLDYVDEDEIMAPVFETQMADATKEASPEEVEVVTQQPATPATSSDEDVTIVAEKAVLACTGTHDAFITNFLAMPNGRGIDHVSRKQTEGLVKLHVSSLAERTTHPYKRNNMQKQVKEAIKDAIAIELAGPDVAIPLVEQETETLSTKTVDLIEELMIAPEYPIEDETKHTMTEQSQQQVSDSEKETASRTSPCSGRRSSTAASSVQSSTQTIVDLDRKTHTARNNYLGQTSLEDFVNILEFESDGSTTKHDICDAFAALSADEFEALQGRHPDVIDFSLDSVIAQRKIKLGRTSLYTFLHAIDFVGGIAQIKDVTKTFRKAATGDDAPSEKLKKALLFEEE